MPRGNDRTFKISYVICNEGRNVRSDTESEISTIGILEWIEQKQIEIQNTKGFELAKVRVVDTELVSSSAGA